MKSHYIFLQVSLKLCIIPSLIITSLYSQNIPTLFQLGIKTIIQSEKGLKLLDAYIKSGIYGEKDLPENINVAIKRALIDRYKIVLWKELKKTNLKAKKLLLGHTKPINALAITPNGSRLITGSEDNTAVLWNLADIEQPIPIILRGHTNSITSVAITPDGLWALTGSKDNTAVLWNLADIEHPIPIILRGHTNSITSIAITPDAKWALTGSEDNTAILWNLEDIEQPIPIILSGHTNSITSVAITPDAKWALTGSKDNTAVLWNLADIEQPIPIVLSGHTNSITSIAITPDAKWALTSSIDCLAILWNLEDKDNPKSIVLRSNIAAITSAELTSDSKWALIGCCGQDNDDSWYSTILWDLTNKANPKDISLESNAGWTTCIALTSNNQWALIGHQDGSIILWDLINKRDPQAMVLGQFKRCIHLLAITEDSRWVASNFLGDIMIYLWDLAEELDKQSLSELVAHILNYYKNISCVIS